ncbi:MAG: N-acetylmuramoyl-L-alanine amidase, partial [Chloroflexota bacterium]
YQSGRIADPDRIFFDLFRTQLNSPLVGKTFEIEAGMLRRIRVAENREGVTRVVLEVAQAYDYSIFSLPNPFRLVVDVRGLKTASAKKPEPPVAAKKEPGAQPPGGEASPKTSPTLPQAPAAPQPTSEGQQTLTRVLGLKVNRIVLDPGHGGHDTGTIGPNGFMEKDLALDVARRLGQLLKQRLGAEVVLTREDDTFVPLENRTALANEKQADLFLSLHANSSRDTGVRGVETLFLNFTTDQEALELAARENALSQKSVHELQDLVRTITRNEKIDESRELARELQSTLHKELRRADRQVRNRGVKQAPFVVLIGANMPSVLTEMAFLSNQRDEGFLKTSRGRQRLAQALFAGISNYLRDLNSMDVARVPAALPAGG